MKKLIMISLFYFPFFYLQSTSNAERRGVHIECFSEGSSKRMNVWNTEICGRYEVIGFDQKDTLSFYSNGIYQGDFSFSYLKKYIEKHRFLKRKEKKLFKKSLEEHF
jgi:acid phosphatase class B